MNNQQKLAARNSFFTKNSGRKNDKNKNVEREIATEAKSSVRHNFKNNKQGS
jgi:hypothetical protein